MKASELIERLFKKIEDEGDHDIIVYCPMNDDLVGAFAIITHMSGTLAEAFQIIGRNEHDEI